MTHFSNLLDGLNQTQANESHAMVSCLSPTLTDSVRLLSEAELNERLPLLTDFVMGGTRVPLTKHPRWLSVLRTGLGHKTYALEVTDDDGFTCGFLPLSFLSSLLFGKQLVSLPYLNSNGVIARDEKTAGRLIDRAVELAAELGVRRLELRHEGPTDHPALTGTLTSKVHMRMDLPEDTDLLWKMIGSKVRNQVRKGEKSDLTVHWGGTELLPEFYSIFSQNMRDLGTPVYGRGLFRSILTTFDENAELCVVRKEGVATSAALLLHGNDVTEVPSASTLRKYNPFCANMLMYWNLLSRAVERGQTVFDFGRTTMGSPLFNFKKQWGAQPEPATWQFHLRRGSVTELRPDNPKFRRMIKLWRWLPLSVTRWLGPTIVRGIP